MHEQVCKGEYSCIADNNDTEGESDKISVNVIRGVILLKNILYIKSRVLIMKFVQQKKT